MLKHKYPKILVLTHHTILSFLLIVSSLPQVTPSWYDNVLPKSRPGVWLQHFRMPETIVDEICELVRDDMSPQERCVREPVPLKKR